MTANSSCHLTKRKKNLCQKRTTNDKKQRIQNSVTHGHYHEQHEYKQPLERDLY